MICLLLVPCIYISLAASAELVYVKPTTTSSSCPDQPCLTLDEYLEFQEDYFTTGVTFQFMAGNHNLNSGIYLENVFNMTFKKYGTDSTVNVLRMNKSSSIHCHDVTGFKIEGIMFLFTANIDENSSLFTFVNSKEISFISLIFRGNLNYSGDFIRSALINNSNVAIQSCLFEGNMGVDGGALSVYSSKITVIECTFSDNRASHYGGAIFAFNSTVLVKDGKFVRNFATMGGAMRVQNATLLLSGEYTLFQNNSAERIGGACCSISSAVNISSDQSNFTGNYAEQAGGAYFGSYGSLHFEASANQQFEKNSVNQNTGGAIHFQYGDLTLDGSSQFLGNAVQVSTGGALFTISCNLTLSGSALFHDNRATEGGALGSQSSNIVFGAVSIEFINNWAHVAGGGMAMADSTLKAVTGQVNFVNNSASGGGGLHMFASQVTMKNVNFTNNTAKNGGGFYCIRSYLNSWIIAGTFMKNTGYNGGGIELILCNVSHHDLTVENNTGNGLLCSQSNATFSGITSILGNTARFGSGMLAQQSVITFNGVTVFKDNYAREPSGGGLMGVFRSRILFSGNTSFINNTALVGGAIIISIDTGIVLSGNALFLNNTAQQGGALYVDVDGSITINGNTVFVHNSAENGSAMYFQNGGTMTLNRNSNLTLSRNHASMYGGGIYHEDSITSSQCKFKRSESNLMDVSELPTCFLDLESLNSSSKNSYTILSDMNSAGYNGHFLFGGLIDKCRIVSIDQVSETEIFDWDVLYEILLEDNILDIRSNNTNGSGGIITSEPYTLCFCSNKTDYNCTASINIEVYRGRKFDVSLLALAQVSSIASATVRAESSPTTRLQLEQDAKVLHRNCTTLFYTLYSTEEHGELVLYPDNGGCRDTGLARAIMNVTFLKCPDAFNQTQDYCTCEDRLLEYGAECVISDTEFLIKKKAESTFWVNALYTDDGRYSGLILYKTCPIEYCKTGEVDITLSDQDIQCDNNRGKILCGACAANYSLMLGSSRCGKCSNNFLVLLVAFAAAGMSLVVLLSVLRLTVATGMINSIILYANILQANRNLLFPGATHTNVLTVFIAWVNLDLGFQTCFYDGMTAYAQTWLQFAFPVYVWLLIGLIIVISRYSSMVTRLIGSNPIAVLATLLLLSYAKVLKSIIEIYSSVQLDYPNKRTVVWLKDANVPYLKHGHLWLALVTTVFVAIVFLPYTLLLLFGYKLYRFSGKKYLTWMYKFKPLLDSYYAPYQKHTRYWTGLLLLVRCGLYTIFSNNSLGGAHVSLLSIVVVFTSLIVLAWLSVKVYTSFYANAIEGLVYLNLIALSAASSNGANSAALANSMVGIVFSIVAGIFAYHFHVLYIAKSNVFTRVRVQTTTLGINLKKRVGLFTPEAPPPPAPFNAPRNLPNVITKSEIEPLLINN